jgi:hypothetical protein
LFVIGFPYEVLLTVNGINLIYQFWVHTQHVGKLGWLDRVLVTPSNHRVHHAQNEIYIDRNYGGIFVLWDRLFGSFQEELDEEPVIVGVRKPLSSWNPFWANLQVYNYLWFDAVRTKQWRDKLGIWFRRTGWRPADVQLDYPKATSDLQHFQKFDPPLPGARKAYVTSQFVVAALAVLWTGALYASGGLSAALIPSVQIWALMYTVGRLNEGRGHALAFELVRLLVLLPLGVAGMMRQSVLPADDFRLWAGLGAYLALSATFCGFLFIKQKVK